MGILEKKSLSEMRNFIDEVTRERFDSDRLDRALNTAYGAICSLNEFPWLRETVTIAVTATQTIFDYPANYRQTQQLSLDDSTNVDDGKVFTKESDFQDISENLKTGRKRFEFFTAPGSQLKLRYFITPEKLRNDNDIPIMPEYYHRLIEIKAALELLRIDNRDKSQITDFEREELKLTNELLSYDKNDPSRKKRLVPAGDDGKPILEFIQLGDGF